MRILVLGAGPIEIGQAAEFDYAGTQACIALREQGHEVVLVNSNPATIMTDPEIADQVYIEPLSWEVVERILAREQPEAILATMGGQTALNLSLELAKRNLLAPRGISLLGTGIESIRLAEDRAAFRGLLAQLELPAPDSVLVEEEAQAQQFAREIGFPVVVRPAYTLGGSGGGLAKNGEELTRFTLSGLRQSPVGQVLVEQSIAGLLEIEYEVLRDEQGRQLIVAALENLDPVGIHTGDSLVVSPPRSLSAKQQEMLRQAALQVVEALGVIGSCNVQFALNPVTSQYYFIEVNPRVSRSSALASKATGFPIAKVAAQLAVGGSLLGYKEPRLYYTVVKIPRWPFDKFKTAQRQLGTEMKSTGEVLAIGGSLAEALQKAVRSLELPWKSLFEYPFQKLSPRDLKQRLLHADDERLFLLAEYFRRGLPLLALSRGTKMPAWFLQQLSDLVSFYESLTAANLSSTKLAAAKRLGFSDQDLALKTGLTAPGIRKRRALADIEPSFYRLPAQEGNSYFSSYQAGLGPKARPLPPGQAVVVLGAGPIRIGQGIEFDYSTVHAAQALAGQGYQSVIINNNPETVSTDAAIANRLYFEPLTEEDVLAVLAREQPEGVLVQFGGQTSLNLVEPLAAAKIKILGTGPAGIAGMEDRQRFDAALFELGLLRPRGFAARDKEEAFSLSPSLPYPVMVRPSYVLGGRGMEVVASPTELAAYLAGYTSSEGYPLLLDHYLAGIELEVDALTDGQDVFLPGVMEHWERAGVHSGDSIAVYPAPSLSKAQMDEVLAYTKALAQKFNVRGLLNIQYVLAEEKLYVLEVNPRSSRTVPFLSKVTGLPLAKLATKLSLGLKLADLGYQGLWPQPRGMVAVKMPVFSFAKLAGMEITLGPEMKSTGEVMGRDLSLAKALHKAFLASGVPLPAKKRAFVTIADQDKGEFLPFARRLQRLGLKLIATKGTAHYLAAQGIPCQVVPKLHESPEIVRLLEEQSLDFVVNTITKGNQPHRDGFKIRSQASLAGILCFTSLDTLAAYLQVVEDQAFWLQPLGKGEY